jgi:Zn-finger nucleic acid-binding protein
MLAENFAAYSCGDCLGTLVSLVAYRAWRENSGRGQIAATSAAIAEPEPGADAEVEPPDSTDAKKCPKCRALMSKYRISAEKRNRLDYCAHCEEVWLDDGEWQLVESLAITGELAKVFTQAWQYAVRAGISHGMEEQRLRQLLGDNYERVVRFAEWLQLQPAKTEILARLSRQAR